MKHVGSDFSINCWVLLFRTVCTERTASSFCSFRHKTIQQITDQICPHNLKSSVKAGGGYNKFKFVIWIFQAKHSGESFTGRPDKMIHNQNVTIPPATHLIADLEPHSLYAVRVACHSSQGPSDWSPWVELRTKEGGEPSKWGDVCFQCVWDHLLWSGSRQCYLATGWGLLRSVL